MSGIDKTNNDFFQEVRKNRDFEKASELIPYARFLGITFSEENGKLIFKLPFVEKNIGIRIQVIFHRKKCSLITGNPNIIVAGKNNTCFNI